MCWTLLNEAFVLAGTALLGVGIYGKTARHRRNGRLGAGAALLLLVLARYHALGYIYFVQVLQPLLLAILVPAALWVLEEWRDRRFPKSER